MGSSVPPGAPQMEYGADEISAIVLDPGYSVTRAGFAGEDTPKSIIPSYYGSSSSTQYVFDDNAIHNPISQLDVKNPMASDSTVEDWEAASRLWEYTITSRLTGPKQTSPLRNGLNDVQDGDNDTRMEDVENNEKPLAENPLLVTEPTWNSSKNREKAIELALEDWGAPAFYLAKSGVMAAFASGKAQALVIDVGAATTSVTPVYDGLVLKKSTVKSPLAGNWVSDQIRTMLAKHRTPPIDIVPYYKVLSKTPVDADKEAQAVYRSFATPPADNFRRLQEERVLTEFKESCVQIWSPPRNNNQSLQQSQDLLKSEPHKPFEMPNGFNTTFGVERYKVAEGLFDHNAAYQESTTGLEAATRNQTIPGLLSSSLSAVDSDVKAHLINNLVVTGGSSLIMGLADRVHFEVVNLYAGAKVKLTAPGNVVERKYASWIGGSILASLGTFHQMWISKKEYEESGASIVEKRCK